MELVIRLVGEAANHCHAPGVYRRDKLPVVGESAVVLMHTGTQKKWLIWKGVCLQKKEIAIYYPWEW